LNNIQITEPIIPYKEDEYKFYVNLYLENQYINDIQIEHYIDNGCFCKLCNKKRRNIFLRAKGGETNFEKIVHVNVVNEEVENRNKILADKLKEKTKELKMLKTNKKFIPNQFAIHL
jgi:hypothetical protein